MRVRNAPVEDVRQVKLQQALSQGHKGQQASVEEKEEQQPSAHGEAVRHGAVLQGDTGQLPGKGKQNLHNTIKISPFTHAMAKKETL